jgi:DNA invertase Pin-like site-specific DNA recombinase
VPTDEAADIAVFDPCESRPEACLASHGCLEVLPVTLTSHGGLGGGFGKSRSDEQARSGHGLDAQRAAIAEHAERKGWAVEWCEDEGLTGSKFNHGLRRALDLLRTKQADALVVTKMDRLARSVVNAADIMRAAQYQGWSLVVLDLGMNLSTPSGKAMAQMLAVFAELERR